MLTICSLDRSKLSWCLLHYEWNRVCLELAASRLSLASRFQFHLFALETISYIFAQMWIQNQVFGFLFKSDYNSLLFSSLLVFLLTWFNTVFVEWNATHSQLHVLLQLWDWQTIISMICFRTTASFGRGWDSQVGSEDDLTNGYCICSQLYPESSAFKTMRQCVCVDSIIGCRNRHISYFGIWKLSLLWLSIFGCLLSPEFWQQYSSPSAFIHHDTRVRNHNTQKWCLLSVVY